MIQRYSILSAKEWREGKRIGNEVPRVKSHTEPKVEKISLDLSDEELMQLSRSRVLALNGDEMRAIRNHFKELNREATDCEIEVIAQTWSEHCKHKIFAADIDYKDTVNNSEETIHSLYKSYIKRTTQELRDEKPWIKSVFDDNAGIIQIDDDTLFAMKVETHNSPSALDPYGGALTGIVGVNRDIIGCGMASKPILNTDVFCFASPYFKGELPPKLLHPGRIFRGVHRGVKDGGNESGIPVVNGSIYFDNRYIGKPLVFCGTGGLMPVTVNGKSSWKKEAKRGDLVIMCGGRVGKDGIHGATFSSEELHDGSPATAVQIGDAIVQKRMLDFILESRDKDLYHAITDNGFLDIFYNDMQAAHLDMKFLHDGNPKYKLEAVWDFREKLPEKEFKPRDRKDLNNTLVDVIGRLNIASKEDWVRQYDHEVQGRSAGKPFCGVEHDGPSDAGVLRVSPFKKSAIVVSHGIKPSFSDIDCYHMTASIIDEAVRNAVCVGADPDFMSGLDNFCWPDPVYDEVKNSDGKAKLAQLVRSNKALYECCKQYSIPLISGKDSMHNDYGSGKDKISIPPTLLFTLISKMDDVERMVSMDFKHVGDKIYLIGETKEELGGSEFYLYHGIRTEGYVPKVEPQRFMKNYRALHSAICRGLVCSAHDLSDGGLAVALSESSFAGMLGARVDLTKVLKSAGVTRDDTLLFSESNGRILVSVPSDEEKRAEFEELMSGCDCREIGEVTDNRSLKISGLNEDFVVDIDIATLKASWKGLMDKMR